MQGLLEAFSETCERCKGRGVIIHTEPVADKTKPATSEKVKVVTATATAPEQAGAGSRRRGRKGAAERTVAEVAEAGDSGAAEPIAAVAVLTEDDTMGYDLSRYETDTVTDGGLGRGGPGRRGAAGRRRRPGRSGRRRGVVRRGRWSSACPSRHRPAAYALLTSTATSDGASVAVRPPWGPVRVGGPRRPRHGGPVPVARIRGTAGTDGAAGPPRRRYAGHRGDPVWATGRPMAYPCLRRTFVRQVLACPPR